MRVNKLRICVLLVLYFSLVLTGCYKEEHFDFPGPYDEVGLTKPDSIPFPFDKNRQAGQWLMKAGVPDYGKILFKGYTDYFAKADTLSWVKSTDGFHLAPHFAFYRLSDADHFAGDPNAYKYNWVYSKYFVPIGAGKRFYMYTKVTFGTFNSTAAGLQLGRNWAGDPFVFGMDGNSTTGEPRFFLDLYGKNGVSVNPDLGWPTITQVMTPGVPAEMEVIIIDGTFYIKINGKLVFNFKLPSDQVYYYTPTIRPWRNFVTVHDMYIESNDMYKMDYAMHEYEKGYNKIQAPALAKASNGDLLLFAEGRSAPTTAMERVAQNTIPVGNTDIIMKRSADGGTTWNEQLTVLAGDGDGATYCFPQIVTQESGKIILHYSKIGGAFSGSPRGAFNIANYTYNRTTQVVYQRTSIDNGLTWSNPVDITTSIKDNASYLQNGPGHGIELKSALYNKRLIMPLSYINTDAVKTAISNDGGLTWSISNAVAGSRYASVVELADGRLMMILGHKNTSPKNKRVSYSTNGGTTWSAATNIVADIKTGDFGQLYPGVTIKGKNGEIFFVNSTNRETDADVKNSPVYPTAPVLFKSTNNGLSFTSSGQLFTKVAYFGYNAPFGSMDAVVLDNGTVVIAGEGGAESPAEGIVIYKK